MVHLRACEEADANHFGKLEKWLRVNHRSPITGAPLPHKHLNPNQALKSWIQSWEEQEHNKCMAMAQP